MTQQVEAAANGLKRQAAVVILCDHVGDDIELAQLELQCAQIRRAIAEARDTGREAEAASKRREDELKVRHRRSVDVVTKMIEEQRAAGIGLKEKLGE
jgi:hypothetical protein